MEVSILNDSLFLRLYSTVDVSLCLNYSSQFCNERPFSYSEKVGQSNDTLLHFVEFSNVHNTDRSSDATRSNLAYKGV